VTVRFRDIANTGKILDALVAQGANQINGPMLGIDKPEGALDEARTKALAAARARAELYARATGKRVGRILRSAKAAAAWANADVPGQCNGGERGQQDGDQPGRAEPVGDAGGQLRTRIGMKKGRPIQPGRPQF
jgi:hypothetical protein